MSTRERRRRAMSTKSRPMARRRSWRDCRPRVSPASKPTATTRSMPQQAARSRKSAPITASRPTRQPPTRSLSRSPLTRRLRRSMPGQGPVGSVYKIGTAGSGGMQGTFQSTVHDAGRRRSGERSPGKPTRRTAAQSPFKPAPAMSPAPMRRGAPGQRRTLSRAARLFLPRPPAFCSTRLGSREQAHAPKLSGVQRLLPATQPSPDRQPRKARRRGCRF